MRLILASHSPRRKELLQLLNIPFTIIPTDIEEKVYKLGDVLKVAEEKALNVFEKNRDAVVIGSDTVVLIHNEILEKPKDLSDAKKMLARLSGQKHIVATGVAILSQSRKEKALIKTEVFVEKIETEEIERYLKEEFVFDAAGAYKIQGCFSKFISKIKGDYFNIVGFPVHYVYQTLKLF